MKENQSIVKLNSNRCLVYLREKLRWLLELYGHLDEKVPCLAAVCSLCDKTPELPRTGQLDRALRPSDRSLAILFAKFKSKNWVGRRARYRERDQTMCNLPFTKLGSLFKASSASSRAPLVSPICSRHRDREHKAFLSPGCSSKACYIKQDFR